MVLDLREETLKAMRAAPVILRQLVRGLGDDDQRRRPALDEWAVIEVVAHLADTEERALGRVRRMLSEELPYLPGYDQEALARERRYIERSLAEELARYEHQRQEHVAHLAGLDDAGWERAGRHETHGPMTVLLHESHVANEDIDHLAQTARLCDEG